MTRKQTLKELADTISSQLGGKSTHVHIGTWMDRPGMSIEIRLQSAVDGKRIVVHKWDDEDVCNVRYIFGSFWRPRKNREGVEYARKDDVPFTISGVVFTAHGILNSVPA